MNCGNATILLLLMVLQTCPFSSGANRRYSHNSQAGAVRIRQFLREPKLPVKDLRKQAVHSYPECRLSKCCHEKIRQWSKAFVLLTPFFSGLLSAGLINGFADPTLICSTYYTTTATATNTFFEDVTYTVTQTTTSTATNTIPLTISLTATAMVTITTTTTVTAALVTSTVTSPVTAVSTATVTITLPRTDCNNGRKRRNLSVHVEEDYDAVSAAVEPLEPGPPPTSETIICLESSFGTTHSAAIH